MSQGTLPFKYEEENRYGERMTARAGLPVYKVFLLVMNKDGSQS